MGFKNIPDFNVAMVGKQSWMLIVHHESLVAIVYKARFYPSGSFFSAKLGGNPSYMWRSVLAAQEMLKKVQLVLLEIGVRCIF